jgi:hypothetical protein
LDQHEEALDVALAHGTGLVDRALRLRASGTAVAPRYFPLAGLRAPGFGRRPQDLSATRAHRGLFFGYTGAQSFPQSGHRGRVPETLDEVLLLAEDVPDVRVVLVLDVSQGADVILGRPEIARFDELRGRRVGYEATALDAFMLARGSRPSMIL